MTDHIPDPAAAESHLPSPDQLAMSVGVTFLLTVDEQRDGGTALTVGPLEESAARTLAGLLLNRSQSPTGPGPWRCAIAGGSRLVTLTQVA